MMPDTDWLYLRDDERDTLEHMRNRHMSQLRCAYFYEQSLNRLIEARKEIARLQIASGEVIPQSIGDEVI